MLVVDADLTQNRTPPSRRSMSGHIAHPGQVTGPVVGGRASVRRPAHGIPVAAPPAIAGPLDRELA